METDCCELLANFGHSRRHVKLFAAACSGEIDVQIQTSRSYDLLFKVESIRHH